MEDFEKTIQEWAYMPIVRFLTFGFDKMHLSCILDAIPPHIAVEFKRMLQKVQDILQQRMDNLAHIQFTRNMTTASEYVDRATCDKDEAELWQAQNVCGFLKCTYEKLYCGPSEMHFNDKLTELLGLDRDQFQLLRSKNKLKLPFSEVDLFFLLIHETKYSTECRTDRCQGSEIL